VNFLKGTEGVKSARYAAGLIRYAAGLIRYAAGLIRYAAGA